MGNRSDSVIPAQAREPGMDTEKAGGQVGSECELGEEMVTTISSSRANHPRNL